MAFSFSKFFWGQASQQHEDRYHSTRKRKGEQRMGQANKYGEEKTDARSEDESELQDNEIFVWRIG